MKAVDVKNYIKAVKGDSWDMVVPKLTKSSIDILRNIIEEAKVVKDEYRRKYFWLTAEGEDGGKEFISVMLDLEKAIFIDHELMGDLDVEDIEISEYRYREYLSQETHDLFELYTWALEGIKDVIDMLKKGTYEDYILKELPIRCRSGVIKLSKYWKYCPEDKVQFYKKNGLEDQELLDEFMSWVDNNRISNQGYKRMTPALFYDACYYVYKYNGLDVEGLTPKEAYLRYADGRDMGFTELPDNDYKALEEWVNSYGWGDHADEIYFGMVHMWFDKNIWGKWTFYVAESRDKSYRENTKKLVLDMVKSGFYMDTGFYSDEVEHIRGNCMAAIDPEKQSFDYRQAMDMKLNVRDHIRYYPEPFPEELIKKIKWLRPKICELKEQ